jgi:hypothetical protein
MNDYDNRQLIGRGQRLPYVNDHDKRASENKADIDAYRYMLKQKGVYDGKETFTKEHLKTIPRISVENAFKETTLIKSDLAYEQRGFISVSAFGFAACRGSSPLVPYNNSQRVMKAQAGMQIGMQLEMLTTTALCKLLRYLTLLEYLPIRCTMPIKIWLQEKGPLQIWDLIY